MPYLGLRPVNASLFLLMFLLSNTSLFSQKEQRYWIWGRGSTPGNIEFDTTASSPWIGNSPPSSLPNFGREGTGVATDPSTGDLLFYTDGDDVYDANHIKVDSGLGADPSSAQPVALCVLPICPFDSFYIFSNTTATGTTGAEGPITFRKYDISSQSFSTSDTLLGASGPIDMAEGMIVIPNPTDPLEFWLITHELKSNRFPVFRIDPNGIFLDSTFSMTSWTNTDPEGFGNIAFTPQSYDNPNVGEVAFMYGSIGVYTCQFDPSIGQFATTTWEKIAGPSDTEGLDYDVEWSPSGRYLYYSSYEPTIVYQFDDSLPPSNQASSDTVPLTGSDNVKGGGIKLGPDGYIYHIRVGSNNGTLPGEAIIGRIETPDVRVSNPNFYYDANTFVFDTLFCFNWPEFITRPVWKATVIVLGENSICPNEETQLAVSTTSAGAIISGYQWYQDTFPIVGANQALFTTSTPGTYQVEVLFSNGCSVTSIPEIIEESENCCTALDDSIYIQIEQPIVITENTTWQGKVYIHPGVVVTIEAAVLDLTNVDIVFGPCAGIDFVLGAEIRANNSVFRSCDRLESWRGVRILSGSEGTVNQCTFKNAQTALFFMGGFLSQSNSAKSNITNNLFSNCRIGVHSAINNFDASISGNSFWVDDSEVDFSPTSCPLQRVYSNDHYGIVGFASYFSGNISQNDFFNASEKGTPKEFHGIELVSSFAKISLNRFTNMFRSVDISSTNSASLENNELEITRQFDNLNHQIRISDSDNISVTGNTLTNITPYSTPSLNSSGIYAENSNYLFVHHNEVSGFELGIRGINLNASSIGENLIENGRFIGIYLSNGAGNDLTCNSIEMSLRGSAYSIGIEITQNQSSNLMNSVRNNCIFDSKYGLVLFSMTPSSTMPKVVNNYLFNYSEIGIVNVGFSGGIGSGISSFTDAGRNTFVSNNTPLGTHDILSTTPIIAAGNYGISTISTGVTVLGNNLFNSSAKCGNQIGTVSQQLTGDEICDEFEFGPTTLFKVIRNELQLIPEFQRILNVFPKNERFSIAMGVIPILKKDLSNELYEEYIHELESSSNLFSATEIDIMRFYGTLIDQDLLQSELQLNRIQPESDNQAEWKMIQSAHLNMLKNGLVLDSSLVRALINSDQQEGRFSDLARDYLNVALGEHEYRFKPVPQVPIEKLNGPKITLSEGNLTVFPNPAREIVKIQLAIPGAGDSALEIVDLVGRLVFRKNFESNSTEIEIELNNYPEGVYLVLLWNNGHLIESNKLLKYD